MFKLTKNEPPTDDGKYVFKESDFESLDLIRESGLYRLYATKPDGSDKGFKAIAINLYSYSAGGEEWDESTSYDELFEVVAYYDGVRHFEMRRDYKDDAGYLYCPEMDDLCAMIEAVRALENERCDK